MPNPFTIRATEFVRSNEAFLTLIAPDPVSYFLEPFAKDDGLFRRLLAIQGQPGSGKTTIARLFEFSTLAALQRGAENETYSELIGPLQKCGAIRDGLIQILACRLPLESDYRELWQLPYEERIRHELLQRLVQARAMLSWFNQLRKAGISPEAVSIQPRDETLASSASVVGITGTQALERAKTIEAAIYRIVGSLVPPSHTEIENDILQPYKPFDVVDRICITSSDASNITSAQSLRPLVILDDAHFLHAPQLNQLKSWLVRRELSIARWILSRLDVLQPKELFASLASESAEVNMPGITDRRDIIRINLQNTSKRDEGRRNFRSMARQMSKKYLNQMRIFVDNSITTLDEMLPAKVDMISESNQAKLQKSLNVLARRFHVSNKRMAEFATMASDHLSGRREEAEDLKLAIIRILIHRYAKRTPQTSLFPEDEGPEPAKPLRVDLSVQDGARIQLMHEYERPYYVGFDSLSDAASENAETFLRLASHIVDAAENLLIKQKPPIIQAREQHKLLVERANMVVEGWNFPEHRRVRTLVSWIADRCKQRTLEPNAPLGHGANAYGILQSELPQIENEGSTLANVLKFAVAYNALTLVPNYECKNKLWCLLELGGVFIVRSGLPFKRGGFIEGSADELHRQLEAIS